MARDRYRFLPNDPAPYFVTATTVNWLPLFSNRNIAQIIIDSLKFLIDNSRVILHAYCLMENHVHLIGYAEDLGKEIANFKSFTARESIDYYKRCNNRFLLSQLALFKQEYKKDRPYQFWQEGSHPIRIPNREMMEQKIEYIHQNPVRRGYVDEQEHWRYSSAKIYAGREGLLPVSMDW
jgi:REP element-mobilizing transposase RayT